MVYEYFAPFSTEVTSHLRQCVNGFASTGTAIHDDNNSGFDKYWFDLIRLCVFYCLVYLYVHSSMGSLCNGNKIYKIVFSDLIG